VLSDSATERLAVERSNIALSPTTSAADIALAHKGLSRRDEHEAHGYVRHPTDPATPEH